MQKDAKKKKSPKTKVIKRKKNTKPNVVKLTKPKVEEKTEEKIEQDNGFVPFDISTSFDETIAKEQNKDSFGIENISAQELLENSINDVPCLIPSIFHKVGLAALIGSSDTGKSALLRQLCVSVITGKKFLNWEVNPTHFRAYYISTEDDKTAISSMLKKQNQQWHIATNKMDNLIFVFDTENITKRLELMLIDKPADVVVIDAFSDIYSGQLYETNKVRECLNEYNRIAQKYGCLIIFLHHTNKRSDELAPSKHNALGSQGFEAKMRLMIELKKNALNPADKYFCIVKGNYLSFDYKTMAYDLHFDENLSFSSLDTMTSFERINKEKSDMDQLEQDYNDAMKKREEGMTWQEVANSLGVPRSSMLYRLKKWSSHLKKLGKPISVEFDSDNINTTINDK